MESETRKTKLLSQLVYLFVFTQGVCVFMSVFVCVCLCVPSKLISKLKACTTFIY